MISTRQSALIASGSPHRQNQPQQVLSLGADRVVYQAKSPQRSRRLKACMKQVVGGAFCGISNPDLEAAIVRSLTSAAKECAYNPMKTQLHNDKVLEHAAAHIVEMLQTLLRPRVTKYLWALVNKLFDRKIKLRWDIRVNNCQKFCASILDYNVFGSFFATECGCRDRLLKDPLYLVSFVCPPGAYDLPVRVRPRSKRVAPNGLTEEYLFRFYKYGHHNEADILDTLLEYWKDWAAMDETIFYRQELFPWDCTEACQMGTENNNAGVDCGDCTIVQHAWAFPFDSWSVIQLHLFRERRFYSPRDKKATSLSEAAWIQNRLEVLGALWALNHVATAMMNTKQIRAACRWHHAAVNPRPRLFKKPVELNASQYRRVLRSWPRSKTPLSLKPKRKLDPQFCRAREKLAGIFRAQPESHFFEQSKYHDCTLAPWADLVQEDRIRIYLQRRNYRAYKLIDIRDLLKESWDCAIFRDPSDTYPGRDPDPDPDPSATAHVLQNEARSAAQTNQEETTDTTGLQAVPSNVDVEIRRWYEDSNSRTREYVNRVLCITWPQSEHYEPDDMPIYDEWELVTGSKDPPDLVPCPLHTCSTCATGIFEDSIFGSFCAKCSSKRSSRAPRRNAGAHIIGQKQKQSSQIPAQPARPTQSHRQSTSISYANAYRPVYTSRITDNLVLPSSQPMAMMNLATL